MNVSCTNCGKAYVLPAGSAVPGIKLRVKCKSCQQVFEVTEQMMAEAQAKGDEALAAVADAPTVPSDPNAIGEVTRHFIKQSGADKRNPPWKIALFIVGGIGLPVGVLALLSSFHVVGVTVVNEQGEEVQQSFFSAEGVSGLGDVLSGKAAEKRAAAKARAEARRKAELEKQAASGGSMGSPDFGLGGRKGGTTGSGERMGSVTGSLGAFYGDAEKKDRGPKVRKDDDSSAATAHAGGLDDKEAAKVVAHSQMAFQDCIESGLRRNPKLKVGKVAMAVTVAPSGTVKGAAILPKVHESSDWGACLMQRARRMVFPPFEGDEAEIQVPLVVGVSL